MSSNLALESAVARLIRARRALVVAREARLHSAQGADTSLARREHEEAIAEWCQAVHTTCFAAREIP